MHKEMLLPLAATRDLADPTVGLRETFCGAENVVPLSFERATTISLNPPIDCVQLKKTLLPEAAIAQLPNAGTPNSVLRLLLAPKVAPESLECRI